MPTGSFNLGYLPTALSSPALPIQVCRYNSSASSANSAYTPLPNVTWVQTQAREGPFPSLAVFEYLLDDNLAAAYGWPSQSEQVWPINAPQNPYVVQNDDRLVVMTVNVAGNMEILWDGFAQIPQAGITEHSQSIQFTGIDASSREWDAPIKGRFQRGADNPNTDPKTGPVKTDLPCRFNESDTANADGNKGGIIANCTPDNQDVNESDDTSSYPVFLDPAVETTNNANPPNTYWTISKACRYVMAVGNPLEMYVQNPDFSQLTSLLQAYFPASGSGTLSTSGNQTADIVIRDYDASDKAWPEVVAELLGYAGFGMSFTTSTGTDNLPLHEVDIYRRDALSKIAPKNVYLAPSGASLTNTSNNVFSLHLVRDSNGIINQYSIESPLKHVEVSFILAPLYTPNQSDTTPGPTGAGKYVRSSWTPTTAATIRRMYRWYGMDEIGLGHYNIATSAWSKSAFDFTPIFPVKSNGDPLFVKRCRPGSSTLISVDTNGHPLDADLSICFNYTAPGPGIWDGQTGTWFPINGGWKLLDDRLGIEITVDELNTWSSGKAFGKISGIDWWANPSTIPTVVGPNQTPTNGFPPVLRLTTVITDDQMLSAVAPKRTASPTQYTRRKRADCRDHFQYNRILANSLYNTTAKDVIARDDTALAKAHAYALRGKTEFPPVSGSISLPILTDYYQLGDRISRIRGRNISLRTNAGTGTGEAPDYPFVVSLTQQAQPEVATILQLSDHRAEAVNL